MAERMDDPGYSTATGDSYQPGCVDDALEERVGHCPDCRVDEKVLVPDPIIGGGGNWVCRNCALLSAEALLHNLVKEHGDARAIRAITLLEDHRTKRAEQVEDALYELRDAEKRYREFGHHSVNVGIGRVRAILRGEQEWQR